jgi:hypothetical protein
MIIELKKNATTKDVEEALKKIQKNGKKGGKGNAAAFFGKNPAEVDGIKFQKKARKEWD